MSKANAILDTSQVSKGNILQITMNAEFFFSVN